MPISKGYLLWTQIFTFDRINYSEARFTKHVGCSIFNPSVSFCNVYASGPPAMVHAGFDAFKQHGLTEDRYFSDAFEFQAPKAK